MKRRSRTKAHGDLHLAFEPSWEWTRPGRCLGEFHLVDLPLTSKRRSSERRTAHTIFYDVEEEQTAMTWWLQASESIHESTQVEIYGAKGFPAIVSRPLPSRISYRYSNLENPCAPTTSKPSRHALGNLGHRWYCSSPSSRNFL